MLLSVHCKVTRRGERRGSLFCTLAYRLGGTPGPISAGSALSGPGSQAGAEPTPLGGCEKFVIKFPLHASPPIGLQTCARRTRQSRCNRHVDSNRSRSPRLAKVLNSFLQSFKLIEGITSSTETQAGRTCPSRHTVVFLALQPPTSAFAQASKQQNPALPTCLGPSTAMAAPREKSVCFATCPAFLA